MVEGGLELMSYTTLFTPLTSFIILELTGERLIFTAFWRTRFIMTLSQRCWKRTTGMDCMSNTYST